MPASRRFAGRVRRQRRGHERHTDVGPCLADGLSHRIEHRHAERGLPAPPGGHAADHASPMADHPFRMELPFPAGDALHQHRLPSSIRILIHLPPEGFRREPDDQAGRLEHGGSGVEPEAAFPEDAPPFRHVGPFEPHHQRHGDVQLRAAFTMPCATMSQRRIPPKILIRMPRTCGSESMIENPAATVSSLAPPRRQGSWAGSAPACLMASIVAIASPAPFTNVPMEPPSRT